MRLFIGLLVAGSVLSATVDPGLIRARDAQDRGALDKLAASAKAAADKAPKDAEAQYRYALASSYLAEVALEQKDKGAAQRAAEPGIKAAEAAIALNPKQAEYYRVLATLSGQIIPANIFAGFSYGKRAKDAIEKAKQLDPKSSSVWVADGVGNYYLPPQLGGGPDVAIRSFQKAIELDGNNADAWLWLGMAQRKKQDNNEARKSFEKSIALDGNRLWAKEMLSRTPPK
jgi:tetratricopeptide (TPR) repeat protein